jgi:hypothetical protein
MLTTDSDLPFIHDDELAVQTHVGEPGNRESKSGGYCVLRGRVQAQAEDAGRGRRREPEHVGEVTVERNENPSALNRRAPHRGVVCARQPQFRYRCGVVQPSTRMVSACRGERFSSNRNFTLLSGRPHRPPVPPRTPNTRASPQPGAAGRPRAVVQRTRRQPFSQAADKLECGYPSRTACPSSRWTSHQSVLETSYCNCTMLSSS